MSDPSSATPEGASVIHDLGYRPYTGPRLGTGSIARALVVTAGNSNVFTGRAGRETCRATAKAAAELAGCKPREVFLASTGVIGERLPTEKLTGALPALHAALRGDAWPDAARAILTTDTFPKGAVRNH